MLPRASGIDPGPLTQGAIPFRSPESLRVTLDTPHRGPVDGMGVREGITLIVGGGYHGKSTLLAAIAEGVYNHVPGDGRERCVTVSDALAVQSSPGRSVAATDISAFIGQLPDGRNPACFTSGNASGSTSQAASVSEGLEAGAGLLLLDEDASATNFLVRDARMQQLVPDDEEPITVFLDRVHQLSTEHGVSTVLVMGGSGDYFDAANQVIQLLAFSLRDVTARATEIAAASPTARRREGTAGFSFPAVRAPLADQMDPTNEHGHRSIRVPTTHRILFGRHEIDVADVPQLVERGQSLAIGMALERVSGTFDGDCAVRTAIDGVVAEIARDGLDVLDPNRGGGLAGFRGLELAAALNRFRGLQVRQTRLNA